MIAEKEGWAVQAGLRRSTGENSRPSPDNDQTGCGLTDVPGTGAAPLKPSGFALRPASRPVPLPGVRIRRPGGERCEAWHRPSALRRMRSCAAGAEIHCLAACAARHSGGDMTGVRGHAAPHARAGLPGPRPFTTRNRHRSKPGSRPDHLPQPMQWTL